MSTYYLKLNGEIDRRSPQNEGEVSSPMVRENWLARDGILKKPKGTEKAITTTLSDIPRWLGRYYTVETGNISPKTFTYTKNGQLWSTNDIAKTATLLKENLNINSYPRHALFKTANQTNMYFVDGVNLLKHDGNNDNLFLKVTLVDSAGNSVKPIDIIEHLDRLWIISKTDLFVSANLSPEDFSNANDSLQIIVGSGRGTNLRLAKLGDKLYIVNTEGIFGVFGDVISALAATFEVRLVEERKIIAGGSLVKTEKAFVFLAEDYEIWSFDGSQAQLLSYKLKLKDYVNPIRELLDKAVATYFNNYYMLSFVEKGEIEPNIEVWWDSLEGKIDIVRGRHVSCYLEIDPAVENDYLQTGRSDIGLIMNTDRGYNFDGVAIKSRIRTRDVTPEKGTNVRFTAFYPEISPIGDKNITINYLLDGRSSNPTGSDAYWTQNLRGEVKTLGAISIGNQAQTSFRVRPKINYAKGESIAFEITDETLDLRADLVGIGIDFISKGRSKGKIVGQ